MSTGGALVGRRVEERDKYLSLTLNLVVLNEPITDGLTDIGVE